MQVKLSTWASLSHGKPTEAWQELALQQLEECHRVAFSQLCFQNHQRLKDIMGDRVKIIARVDLCLVKLDKTYLGYNHRFFSGYKPEDFIGRIAIVCQSANNSKVEFIALKRFYLGPLNPSSDQNVWVCTCFLLARLWLPIQTCLSFDDMDPSRQKSHLDLEHWDDFSDDN